MSCGANTANIYTSACSRHTQRLYNNGHTRCIRVAHWLKPVQAVNAWSLLVDATPTVWWTPHVTYAESRHSLAYRAGLFRNYRPQPPAESCLYLYPVIRRQECSQDAVASLQYCVPAFEGAREPPLDDATNARPVHSTVAASECRKPGPGMRHN